MKKIVATTLALAITLGLGACKKQDSATTDDGSQAAMPAAGSTSAAGPEQEQTANEPDVQTKRFDAASLPVSDVPLGSFPYIKLPEGYEPTNKTETAEFDQVPLWTGDRLEPVEGKIWWTGVSAVSDKTFSQLELTRNIEAVVTAMGGQKIFDGSLPEAVKEKLTSWPGEPLVRFNEGLGNVQGNPVQVFVIRRTDRNIWINLSSYRLGGGLLIVETKPLQITATLLPADELKSQIDRTGRVALHVNFATDKTQILPDSQPQIDQVVKLLESDSGLKLAINGYTDNTGDAAHNKVLSEGRAKAVLDAIAAKGVNAGRLSSAGFGDTNPVADNATEQGKAKNRRVELVKES